MRARRDAGAALGDLHVVEPELGPAPAAEAQQPRPGAAGMRKQDRIGRNVTVENRGTARHEALEDRRLLARDAADVAERREVDGRHGGDDRDMRPCQPSQRRDLAGRVHPDLEDGEVSLRRQSGQRERHAPVVVEALLRRVHAALRPQRHPQHLLAAGLADRARNSDDPAGEARPRRRPERAQPGEHVGHDEERGVRPPRHPAGAPPSPPPPRAPTPPPRSRAHPAPLSAPRRGLPARASACRSTPPRPTSRARWFRRSPRPPRRASRARSPASAHARPNAPRGLR